MSLFLIAPAVALFFVQTQSAPERCILAGKVVDSATGAPLRRATVTLKQADGKNLQSLETGTDGEFCFEDLAPGAYRVAAKRSGYVEQEYGARRYKERGEEIRLGRGEQKTELVLRLIPPGTIRGRVFDEDMEPMPGVAVTVVRRIYSGGRWQLEQAGSATTDPLGEYVVRDLQPGRYYVEALHRSQSIVFSENPGEPLYGYAPAYHPNAPDSASAVAVQVSAGGEMRGVDIQLRKIRLLCLRGKVIRGDTGKPEPEAQVTLGDMTANSIAFITGQYYAVSDTKGEFEIIGLTPGTYLLQASRHEEGRPSVFDNFPLEIGEQDVEGFTVTLGGWSELNGTVRFDGNEAAKLEGLEVAVDSVDGFFFGAFAADTSGSFEMDNIRSGTYWVTIHGMPSSAYVKSVRYGGREVKDSPLSLGGSAAGKLDIVLGMAGAQISGEVAAGDGQPCKGALVALIPRSASLPLYKTATTDHRGKFRFQGVAPGEYRLLAWEDIEEGAERDPEFVRQFEAQAESVSLKENARVEVRLGVARAGERSER